MIYAHPLDRVGETPLVELRPVGLEHLRIYAKLEDANPTGSIKDRPAAYILDKLSRDGTINKDTLVIESSSGNFGIALSACARHREIRFCCVIDPRITDINERLIRSCGAEVVCVTKLDEAGGYLRTRLAKVKELLERQPNSYWVNQYENPLNAEAYSSLADELRRELERIDYVFVGVSSGGTITGLSQRLKRDYPDVKVIAVDTVGSVIFGGKPAPRWIPGIGSTVVPAILRLATIDDVVMVDERDAIRGCHELLERHALFNGGSSGAALAAIRAYLGKQTFPKPPVVVTIFPDRGERYADTIFDRSWCAKFFDAS